VVSLLALVALIGGILWGKGVAVGVSTKTLRIIFPNASGIEVGAPITLYGVRKGSVTALEVVPEGVRVTAVIEPTIPLHGDATASLQMMELMGGKKIEVDPGKAPSRLPDNATIPGFIQGDIGAILSSAGDLTADARQIIRRLDSAIVSVTGIIDDPRFRSNIRSTLSNLESASVSANDLVKRNQAAINQTIRNLNDLSIDLKGILARTDRAVQSTVGTAQEVAADARQVIGTADGTVRKADSLVTRLDQLVKDLKEGDGLVSKLIYDKEFAEELEETIKSARAYINQIGKNGINLNVGLGRKP
jgi:phospholipid/cholesterol/gamma-HCH transport system substrate-binding protein